ncbi:hypothetical protein V1279_003089 [Bradyrhizobium sp. AZCC 1610]|uniref:hypothetical protein n=1 Tax=Bradyrhizobium sp. AZCC 1610 TaxID=3117020 RepID=UPI002FF13E50
MVLSFDFKASMLAFLREPESLAVIVAFILFGAPPLDGLTRLMNARFPNLTDGEKTTAGKLLRQVCEEMGFRHDRYNIRTKTPGCQFTFASTYTDDAQVLPVAV